MTTLFDLLDVAVKDIEEILSGYTSVDEGHQFPWLNKVYTSQTFRRAHLDVVDVRDTRKLYMVHLTVFPHVNDPAPIFGFDLISGPNKVTGAFHDFSPVKGGTYLDRWFSIASNSFTPIKERKLPDWATEIFSPAMIAAGNVNTVEELGTIIKMVTSNLDYYLMAVGERGDDNYVEQQNKYCRNQKQNPHTPRVMESLGFEKELVDEFIETCLFPEYRCD